VVPVLVPLQVLVVLGSETETRPSHQNSTVQKWYGTRTADYCTSTSTGTSTGAGAAGKTVLVLLDLSLKRECSLVLVLPVVQVLVLGVSDSRTSGTVVDW
jgi:hypothetical protein